MVRDYWCRVHRASVSNAWKKVVGSLQGILVVVVGLALAGYGLTLYGSPEALKDETILRVCFVLAGIVIIFGSYLCGLVQIPSRWDTAQLALIAELEAKISGSLVFNRALREPVGDEGQYSAFIEVRNTSQTEKMKDCRCEIVGLDDEDGVTIRSHIGLRTQNQEGKATQGRFNLDQASTKRLPIFEIDQSQEQGLIVVSADGPNIRLEHGTYTAKIRGYGDSGEPDQIIVRLNSTRAEFTLVD